MLHVPTYCQPTHPGEILWEEFLDPLDLTQRKLANAIHMCDNDILRNRKPQPCPPLT